MTMWSATYERENSQMDLLNVPLNRVTIEVTEENTALITSLRDQLAQAEAKVKELTDARKYWTQRYDEEKRVSADWRGRYETERARKTEGAGHRYVQLVKHLSDRKRALEGVAERAQRDKRWAGAADAQAHLDEIQTALRAAGVL
ncbi:hypothetical protein [Streptomyces sp. NRRL F-2580]|uniref:hypothetical protein n=1 Tax=Streptomyces sp. NRRL F-2580 TaxID=1463841 RepID=UPI0004C895CE|nr:hypothetical protein [Streptomyces sp. NRRL F-2580]